jgi:hypothetical protein
MARRQTTIGALLAALAILLAALAPAALACNKASHCYAYARWDEKNLGGDVSLRTFYASVPHHNEDFVSNEQWTGFALSGTKNPASWVEAGDINGWTSAGGETAGLEYFTAVEYPSGYPTQGFYLAYLHGGPGANNVFEDDIHAAGNGVWAVWLGGSNVWNWGNLPGFAYELEAGMEATNEDITSSGEVTNLAYWSSTSGQLVSRWPGDKPISHATTCFVLNSDVGGWFENKAC